jgi:hypothetical protein
MMDKALVITGINGVTEAIRDFHELGDWEIIFVGDKKSPDLDDSEFERLEYLSVDRQEAFGTKLGEILPHNHYCRKNIGYLWAMHEGYDQIAETDDDNFPKEQWGEWLDIPQDADLLTGPRYPNVYKEFTDQHVWPRGYPLSRVTDEQSLKMEETTITAEDVGVVQGLADIEPDVDAIYRLVMGDTVSFDSRRPVILNDDVYCPFNSQNTLWTNREAFFYTYLPSTVSIRFTDILRGFVAQRGVWALDRNLIFQEATVYQERNEHDLMVDFEHEIECYTQFHETIEALDGTDLDGDAGLDLRTIYESLHEADIVEKAELKRVDAWISDVKQLLA